MVFQKAPFSSKNSNNGNNSKHTTSTTAAANNNKKTTTTATSPATIAAPIDIYDDSGGFETSIINNNLRNGISGRPFNTTSTLSSLVITYDSECLQLVKLKKNKSKKKSKGFSVVLLNWFWITFTFVILVFVLFAIYALEKLRLFFFSSCVNIIVSEEENYWLEMCNKNSCCFNDEKQSFEKNGTTKCQILPCANIQFETEKKNKMTKKYELFEQLHFRDM